MSPKKQGRINHKADYAKCLGSTKKKGPPKTKNEGKGAYKGKNEGNRPSKNFCSAKNSKSAWGLREP